MSMCKRDSTSRQIVPRADACYAILSILGTLTCIISCRSYPGVPDVPREESLLSGSWSGELVGNSARSPSTDATGALYGISTFRMQYSAIFDSDGYLTSLPTGGSTDTRRVWTTPIAREQWFVGSVIELAASRTDEWISEETLVPGEVWVTEVQTTLTITELDVTDDSFRVVCDSVGESTMTRTNLDGEATVLTAASVGTREFEARLNGNVLRCTGRYNLEATYTNYGLETNPYHVDESFEANLVRAGR